MASNAGAHAPLTIVRPPALVSVTKTERSTLGQQPSVAAPTARLGVRKRPKASGSGSGTAAPAPADCKQPNPAEASKKASGSVPAGTAADGNAAAQAEYRRQLLLYVPPEMVPLCADPEASERRIRATFARFEEIMAEQSRWSDEDLLAEDDM